MLATERPTAGTGNSHFVHRWNDGTEQILPGTRNWNGLQPGRVSRSVHACACSSKAGCALAPGLFCIACLEQLSMYKSSSEARPVPPVSFHCSNRVRFASWQQQSKAKASIISIVYIVSDPISSRLTCIGSNSTSSLVAPKILGPADKVR